MIPLAESLLASAVLAAWGEPAVVGGESVSAEFRSPHEPVLSQDGQAVTTRTPSIAVRLADLTAAPSRGVTVVIRSTSYVIQDVHHDSGGMARCYLREVD